MNHKFETRILKEFNESVIDTDHAGFDTLAIALKAARSGRLAPSAVAVYQDALNKRLEEARSQLTRMVVPASVVDWVSPVVRNAETMFDKLDHVLDLVEEYLYDGCKDALEEAISLLDVAQDQLGLVA